MAEAEGYSTHPIDFKRSKSGELKSIITIFSGLILIIIFFKFSGGRLIDPVIESHALSVKEIKSDNSKSIDIASLKGKVNNELKDSGGSYSIYFYDILTGDNFGINEEMIISAGSVNKIPILAALYYYAGKGVVDLDKSITVQATDIQDYGTGSIRYQQPPIVYSVKSLARLMMEASDNTAAYILANQVVGLSDIQKLADEWGLTQTDMVNNKTSVKDMNTIMEKMYKGQITTPELTTEMLGFMDDSDFEDRLPKNLPANVNVIHKIGDDIGKIHDVGIIDLPDRPYYLGVMTTDQTDDASVKNKIARISQIVFTEVTSL